MGVTLVSVLLCFDPRVETGGDNALYWALAQSLAGGDGYRNLIAPGMPPETSVPWGYPALLAVPIWLGASYAQAKILSVLGMVGAMGAFTMLLRRMWPAQPSLAVLIGLLVAVDVRVMGLGTRTLTEAPYLLLSMAALWAFEARSDKGRGLALPALLAASAYLVRPVGISLLVAIPLVLVVRRRWRDLAVTSGVIGLVAGPWHLWALATPSTTEGLYLTNLVKQSKFQADETATVSALGMVDRVWSNIAAYSTELLPSFVLGNDWPDEGMGPLVPVFLALTLTGWLVGLRRIRLAHVYLPLYLGVLFVWLPESVNARYLAVGFPLMVAFSVAGLWWVLNRWVPRGAAAGALLLVVILCGFRIDRMSGEAAWAWKLRAKVSAGNEMAKTHRFMRSYLRLVKVLPEHAEPDAVVVARKPRLAWYYGGLSALRVPNGDDPQELMAWLEEREADYLVLDRIDDIRKVTPATRDRFAALLEAWPERFELVVGEPDGDRVVRVLPPSVNDRGRVGSGG